MLIIGISGGSGSGKTSFIRDIKSRFPNGEITLLSQDEYYHPREQQFIDHNGIKNFDLPTSIDLDAFVQDIQKLKSGEIVKRKEYTFNNEKVEAKLLQFNPAKILIVEGLFIFHHEAIRALLDFKIMIYASSAITVIRRIQRDRIERNYPLEDVLYRYEHHVLPAYEQYIEPYIDDVDIVINNNKNYNKALDMFVTYLEVKSSDN
ncbi:MAG: uridine kinase [Saprospiraceae bacterium]|nr:uridine kinase [Saprospiraceae bacterium]